MGEAKDRSKLGPLRRIHVRAMEKADLVAYFTAEQRGGRPGWTAAGRAQRRQLRSALEQLGALELWRVSSNRGRPGARLEIEQVQVHEVSTDAIDFLLEALGATTGSEGLALIDLEERLEEAKRGSYEVPPEVVAEMAEIAAERGRRAGAAAPNGAGAAAPADVAADG